MPFGCLYLNNDGSRWVTRDMRFVLVMPDGTRRVRLADYFYSFGNFSGIAYRVAGKRYTGLPKAHDGGETRDEGATGDNALPHVLHEQQHESFNLADRMKM
jgi:hypothetical protein